jgi:diguanylate cyclase (GGDEF)-like protein
MLHVFGQQPILPIAERSIRDDCAAVLVELEYADLPGEALRLRRGAELTPLHGILRDDYMYRFWWHEMKIDGQIVGIVALYGFVDWVLSPRIRRLLNSVMPMMAVGINNAAVVENLRMQSDRDELTGLLNQRGIFETLDRECARSTEKGNQLSVLLCEIENIEPVMGTIDGDALLQAFSEVSLSTVRTFDIAGRLAESEFAYILPDADADMATAIATELIEAAAGLSVGGMPLGLSIGIAPYEGGTADSLLQQADESLFEARRSRALSSSQVG